MQLVHSVKFSRVFLAPTKSPQSNKYHMPMKTVFEEQLGRDSRSNVNLPDVCVSI